jgi:hypothetical protein
MEGGSHVGCDVRASLPSPPPPPLSPVIPCRCCRAGRAPGGLVFPGGKHQQRAPGRQPALRPEALVLPEQSHLGLCYLDLHGRLYAARLLLLLSLSRLLVIVRHYLDGAVGERLDLHLRVTHGVHGACMRRGPAQGGVRSREALSKPPSLEPAHTHQELHRCGGEPAEVPGSLRCGWRVDLPLFPAEGCLLE